MRIATPLAYSPPAARRASRTVRRREILDDAPCALSNVRSNDDDVGVASGLDESVEITASDLHPIFVPGIRVPIGPYRQLDRYDIGRRRSRSVIAIPSRLGPP
jgi:hypothetical protein